MTLHSRTLIKALFVLPFFILSGCAHTLPGGAQASARQSSRFSYPLTQIYLPDGAIHTASAIPAPPAPGSKEDRADFARLFHLQKTRTARQCVRAASEVNPNLESLFGPKYGPLTEDQVQKWASFFDGAVRSDTDYYVQKLKIHWNRPRPYLANLKILPCVSREGTLAYPSGHATISEVYALILERLVPGKKSAIEARTREIGNDRVLAGVHHPSDIRAGHRLGRELYRAFRKSPAFKKAFAGLHSARHSTPIHSVPIHGGQ